MQRPSCRWATPCWQASMSHAKLGGMQHAHAQADTMCLLLLLQVALHRSDALTTVIDLDKDLRVARADDTAGLMFGVSSKQLHHKLFPRWESVVHAYAIWRHGRLQTGPCSELSGESQNPTCGVLQAGGAARCQSL